MSGRRVTSPLYGEAGYARLADDAYFTIAEWVTGAALERLPLRRDGALWECAAGMAHMARVLRRGGHQVLASDLHDRGWPEADIPFRRADFLAVEPAWQPALAGIRCIITNPPFRDGLDVRFVRRALDLMRPVRGQVAMLLPADFDAAITRVDLFDGHPAFSAYLRLTARPEWFEEKKAGPRRHYAWFFWDWGKPPGPAAHLHHRRGTGR